MKLLSLSLGRTLLLCAALTACGSARPGEEGRERIVGGPCEGCEAVFEGRPDTLSSQARLAPAGEPGQPLRIEGTVRDRGGKPAAGILVYAYQTDAKGIYPPDERLRGLAAFRHGRLRGWARSDAQGNYRFDTIRPGSYPGTANPSHVHMHVIEPGRCTYTIDDAIFEDDPVLTEAARRNMMQGRGGPGLTNPMRDKDGTWLARRDITLGAGIPGHPR